MRQVSILVVEDDTAIAEDLSGKLKSLGYRVMDTVATVAEAITVSTAKHPDLVLLDIRLGGGYHGIDFAARLRSLSDTPVVFLTSDSDQAVLKQSGHRGPFGYILRPFDHRDIMTQIEMALYKYQVEQNVIASQQRYRAVAMKLEHLVAERTQELAREAAAREEAVVLLDVAATLAAERNVEKLVQKVTDAGTALTKAKFGAFFYNALNEHGESYVLYTLSGAPREAFSGFGLPRNTPLFEATFRGTNVLRIDDVLYDKRYGQNPPHRGMPKGHLRVRSYLAVPVISRSGEVLGGLFFGHPDPSMFTERAEEIGKGIAAQAAIALDNARLMTQWEESERRLREIVNALPAAVYTTDATGRLAHYNQAAIELSGRTPKLGTDQWCVTYKLYHVDGTFLPHEESPVALALKEGRITHGIETIAERPDGTRIYVSSYPTLLRDAAGGVTGAINMLVDVTERKRAEEALRNSEERLRELAQSLEQLVEERTIELLESQKHLRALATELNLAEQRERQRIATDLHDHLQQLLVLAKLRLGHGKRVAESVPGGLTFIKQVDEVLSEALQYTRTLVAQLCPPVLREFGLPAALKWLAEQMQQHQINVSVEVANNHDLKLSEEHAVLLFQSARELLMNAAKHAGTREVDLRMSSGDELLRVEVQDAGLGFDINAVRCRSSNAKSSKFGLFSIGERMKALGGTFEIDSTPGRGTTAVLLLPLRDEVPKMRRKSHKEVLTIDGPYEKLTGMDRPRMADSKIRVLLVDDHAMIREGLRSVLESHTGVQVVGEASDGEEAIAMVEKFLPTIILMDINMPKLNGIDATAQIKSRHPNINIIGLSVNAEADNQRAMLQAGADVLLSKEMAVDQLYSVMQNLDGTGAPRRESCGN